MVASDAGAHRFTVYPPNEPLRVPADTATEVAVAQRAGPPVEGHVYAQMMFLRVAATGGAVEPTLLMSAGAGDAVALTPDAAAIYRRPGGVGYVGDVWLDGREPGGVYRIYVGLDAASTEQWRLGIRNNDRLSEYRFSWVVAEDPADTLQPWIDVSPGLSFDLRVGQTETASVLVANFGTVEFAVTGVDPPLSSAFSVDTALPMTVPPAGASPLAVTFTAPAVPPAPDGVVTGSSTVVIVPADTATTTLAGHNATLVYHAKTRWPAPLFGPPGAQFTPSIGAPGTLVTVAGSGFAVGELVVQFGAVVTEPAEVVDDRSVRVEVPAGLLPENVTSRRVAITVSTAGGSVTSDDTFDVVAAPRFPVLYAVNANNDLLWYRNDGFNNGKPEWTDDTGRKVGNGWDFKHLVSGGGGVLYAVNANHDLLWYRHEGFGNGKPEWTDGTGRKVGTGWDFKHLVSGGGGVLYAVNANHDLFWYRHEGFGNGKPEWTDGTGRKVGTGWNFKHLVSGGGGVLYAVNANHDLFWYRHEGFGNGKPEWTDGTGRKVATGWDFKHLVSGGGGVLYAVNADNDLFWYRHEGFGNGKPEWTHGTGRKVGTGWNFKHLCAG